MAIACIPNSLAGIDITLIMNKTRMFKLPMYRLWMHWMGNNKSELNYKSAESKLPRNE